jgi:hypothetical protein
MTPPRGDARVNRFSLVMTEEERAKLEALADADHRSAGDWVRVLIVERYEARFGKKKPKPMK